MPERWTRCAGFPAYEISTSGRARRWHNRRALNVHTNSDGYLVVNMKGPDGWKQPKLHLLVWRSFRGPVAHGHEIDHRDRDPGNPRLSNLRSLTIARNRAYALCHIGPSGYRGVRWSAQHGKWAARVGEDYIGIFDDPVRAARARDKAAIERWGSAAVLNFAGASRGS
jgi:HNH endonuclease